MKEYLGQIRVIDKEVYFKLKEREEFKRSRKAIQAVDYSKDLIQSTPENKIENAVIKLEEFAREISEKINEMVKLKINISKQIDQLENVDERAVLRLRYVEHHTWDEVAEEMHFHVTHVHKIHNRALKSLEKVINNEGGWGDVE